MPDTSKNFCIKDAHKNICKKNSTMKRIKDTTCGVGLGTAHIQCMFKLRISWAIQNYFRKNMNEQFWEKC